jgi:hypothetical protein
MSKQHVIARLQAGETLQYSEPGNSMVGLIKSREEVTLSPVNRELEVDDIVLVKVRGSIYTHKIVAIREKNGKKQYLIGNNHGGINGWTGHDKVYGIVIEISGKPYRNHK